MRKQESKQGKGRKDWREHKNTWGGNFQRRSEGYSEAAKRCQTRKREDEGQISFLGFPIRKPLLNDLYPPSLLFLSALIEPSVTPLRTCAVAVDGLQVREVLDVRRGAGHRQQSR